MKCPHCESENVPDGVTRCPDCNQSLSPPPGNNVRQKVGTVAPGGTVVGIQKIIENVEKIVNVIQQGVTAAEEAEMAREIEHRRLAEGVQAYAQGLGHALDGEVDTTQGEPYKGLQAYTLKDAPLFFGRMQAIDDLYKQALQGKLQGRLTILQAESGAGKSSLLQAGLAPRLLGAGHLPLRVRAYDKSPDLKIKQKLIPDLKGTPELAQAPLREFLRQVSAALGRSTKVVLLLDQFEEFFTWLNDESERQRFVEELADCLNDEILDVHWVLALRSDSFGDLDAFRPRIPSPFANTYRLNHLNLDEAREVITQPAALRGIEFEPALVRELLDDLGGDLEEDEKRIDTTQVQLVCRALYRLFMQRREKDPNLPPRITREMYTLTGKVEGILGQHLKSEIDSLQPTQRNLAWQVLMGLVSSKGRRLRLTRLELSEEIPLGHRPQLGDVLDQLVTSGLLKSHEDYETGAPAYELAHDYLIAKIQITPELMAQKAAQEMLKQEVDAWRDNPALRIPADKLDIIEAQETKLQQSKDAEELLRLSREALERRRRLIRAGAGVAGVLFIVAVISIVIAVGANLEARSAQDEAATAQTAVAIATADLGNLQVELGEAEAQVDTAVAEQTAAIGTAQAADAEATIALMAAATAEARAEKANLVAQSLQLAAQAANVMESNPELGLLLARQAVETTYLVDGTVLPRAGAALQRTLASPFRHVFDGERVATVSADGTITLSDKDGNNPTTLPKPGPLPRAVSLNRDGSQIVGCDISDTGQVKLLDEAGRVLGQVTLQDTTGAVPTVEEADLCASDPLGTRFATATMFGSGQVSVWDNAGNLVVRFQAHRSAVASLDYTPDGRYLVTTGWDSEVAFGREGEGLNTRVWSFDDRLAVELANDGEAIEALHPAPDGERFLALECDLRAGTLNAPMVFGDSGARQCPGAIWNLAAGQAVPLGMPGDYAAAATIVPGGDRVLLLQCEPGTGVGDCGHPRLIAYDLDGQPTDEITVPNLAAVDAGVISPDGQQILVVSASLEPESTLLTGSSPAPMYLWEIGTDRWISIGGPEDHFDWAALSPDGRHLATVIEYQGELSLWDLEGRVLATATLDTEDYRADVWGRFSPNGERIALSACTESHHGGETCDDSTVYLWSPASNQVRSLPAGTGVVSSMEFSPDSRLLALVNKADKLVQLWDVSGTAVERLRATLTGFTSEPLSAAIRPQGDRLLTAHADGTVWLWDLEGNSLGTIKAFGRSLSLAVFSGDGAQVVAVGCDGPPERFQCDPEIIRSWSLWQDTQEMLAEADQRLGAREFTPEECQSYMGSEECP